MAQAPRIVAQEEQDMNDFSNTSPYFIHPAFVAPAIWGADGIGRFYRPAPTLWERVRRFFWHAWHG